LNRKPKFVGAGDFDRAAAEERRYKPLCAVRQMLDNETDGKALSASIADWRGSVSLVSHLAVALEAVEETHLA